MYISEELGGEWRRDWRGMKNGLRERTVSTDAGGRP